MRMPDLLKKAELTMESSDDMCAQIPPELELHRRGFDCRDNEKWKVWLDYENKSSIPD